MSRILKFHFFQVVMPEGSPPFKDLVAAVSGLPHARDRCLERGDDALYANVIERDGALWQGDMIRIRLNDIPLLADLDGNTQDLRLRENQGIGEETAWLFDERTRILVTQGTRVGTSPSGVLSYFCRKAQHDVPASLAPVVKEEILQELRRLPDIRKLHVRVAGAERIVKMARDNPAVRDSLRLPQALQAPVFEFTVSMGHFKGGLGQNVKDIARGLARWFGATPGTPDRVVVSGYDEDHRLQVLDLLEARVVATAPVPDEEGRRVTYATRRELLRRTWVAREAGLRMVYAEPEE